MNLLLDTHVLIWALENNPKLSNQARAAIIDGNNVVFVSSVSAWEISIKKAAGKLKETLINRHILSLSLSM